MQGAVYLLGQFARDARDRGNIVHPGHCHSAHAAKTLQQARAPFRTNARDVGELAAVNTYPGPLGTHAGDGKTMRFVAYLGHQHQRCGVPTQIQLVTPIGKNQFFKSDFAPGPLFDTDNHRKIEPQFLEHGARHTDLAAPTVEPERRRAVGTPQRAPPRLPTRLG